MAMTKTYKYLLLVITVFLKGISAVPDDISPSYVNVIWLAPDVESSTFVKERDFLIHLTEMLTKNTDSIVQVFDVGLFSTTIIDSATPSDSRLQKLREYKPERTSPTSNVVSTQMVIGVLKQVDRGKRGLHGLAKLVLFFGSTCHKLDGRDVGTAKKETDQLKTFMLYSDVGENFDMWQDLATNGDHVLPMNDTNAIDELLVKDSKMKCGIMEFWNELFGLCRPCSAVCSLDGQPSCKNKKHAFQCQYLFERLPAARTKGTTDGIISTITPTPVLTTHDDNKNTADNAPSLKNLLVVAFIVVFILLFLIAVYNCFKGRHIKDRCFNWIWPNNNAEDAFSFELAAVEGGKSQWSSVQEDSGVVLHDETTRKLLSEHDDSSTGSIQESDGSIQEYDGSIQERNGSIQERDGSIQERDGSIQELDGSIHDSNECLVGKQVSDNADGSSGGNTSSSSEDFTSKQKHPPDDDDKWRHEMQMTVEDAVLNYQHAEPFYDIRGKDGREPGDVPEKELPPVPL